MKQRWKAAIGILTAAVVLSGEMNVCAATADVGQVSSYEEDIFQLDDYVTTYTGKVPKNTPTKRVVRAEGYRSTDPNSRWLEGKYKYDAKGNMIRKLEGSGGMGEGLKSTKAGYYYKYDKNGNLVKKTWKNSDGKAISWTVYDVDSDGKLNRMTHYNEDGEGGYSTFVYKKGKIVKRNFYANVNGGVHGVIKYKYNSEGNLTTVTSKNYKFKLTYDTSGRLISVHIDGGGSAARNRQYAYDSDGYLSKITYLFDDGSTNITEFYYETTSPTHKTKKK